MMKKSPESKNGAKGAQNKRGRQEPTPASATGAANGSPSARGGVAGFREQLWASADKLRGNMDAAEYKHVVLGLIFLKYISDAFDQLHVKLAADPKSEPEDRDEYLAENVFWVPEKARWKALQAQSKLPAIGKKLDDAMEAIEADNPSLKGTLPKEYARPQLDKRRLGEVVDLISKVGLVDDQHTSRDLLGQVYEYFLGQFATAEGKKGGQFYTPESVVRTLVEMIEPFKGRVYDPACGSGGMFVQSEKFVESHEGRLGDISIYGQESNPTTWRLCKMNLAIRQIEANLGQQWGDTFHQDQHAGLKADFVLANPPFNDSDWGGGTLLKDVRWKYGAPPVGNANYAWLQHVVSKLGPSGVAGVVLANGSMSTQQSGEGHIRQKMVEADLVDCMVALPGQLFFNTQIPACLWFLARNKAMKGHRKRSGEVLFIDARALGYMVDRTRRALSDDDIQKVAKTYHAWRGERDAGKYKDVAGFCKGAKLAELKQHGFVLTPGRYVGAEKMEDDSEPFEQKMTRLVTQLERQFAEGAKLEKQIRKNLKGLGYGG
ncbi:MAG TPA: class I SAM-dependent DNA methyltransferase [Polyangiaceae bacterium]|jgi:type I restriction enzyme M protein